jgi:hypothetical protein
VLDGCLTLLTPSFSQIFTFYKAQGKKTGASLVEEDKVELAKSLMARCIYLACVLPPSLLPLSLMLNPPPLLRPGRGCQEGRAAAAAHRRGGG